MELKHMSWSYKDSSVELFKVTTTKELQDNDTLAKLSIQRLELQYPPRLCKEFDTERSYADEIEFIVTLERRNRFIRNLALDQNGIHSYYIIM